MSKNVRIAVCGATGAVGQQMLRCLEEQNFPYADLRLLASPRSAGKKIKVKDKLIEVQALAKNSFNNIDVALFSAGGSISRQWAPVAAQAGAVVIDNSSAWRMDPKVPLIVPEVNPGALKDHKGLIANPNCSTVQMLVVAKPLHDAFKIKRIVVSTYQAVSGTGLPGIEELDSQLKAFFAGEPIKNSVYPRQILFNAVPQIDDFLESGYTKEEMKLVNETHKILDPEILVSPTAIRVPVFRGHSEAINIETEKPVSPEEVRSVLSKAKGVKVMDEPFKSVFPTALDVEAHDEVLVGRIRKDPTISRGINMWVVADNVAKGAALNAVQIAELFLEKG